MPIRWRLTVFNALVMGAILTILGASVFFMVRNALLSGVEHTVQDRARGVARTVESGQALSAGDVERLTLEGVFVVVRDEEGRVLARTVETATAGNSYWRRAIESGAPAEGQAEVPPGERGYVYAAPVDPPSPESSYLSPYLYRARALAASSGREGAADDASPVLGKALQIPFPIEARVVEVGKSYESAADTVSTFAALLTAAIFMALLVSAGGAYLLARAALSPVEKVVTSARGITAGNLSKRLPVERPRDEVGRLAATINDLLSRLGAAFARREEALAHQRRFVADASHQLRTPLTSIQGYARLLREWGLRDPETAREAVASIHRESQHMQKLVEDMLSLARGDEGAPLKVAPHDLDALAAEAVEATRVVSNGKPSVRYVPAREPVRASFDRDRVEQAAHILLENAVKYTPEAGEVVVRACRCNGRARLEVSDTGAGIPEEHLPHLVERFYRVDGPRTARGAGLGLSIAQQIAKAHRGNLYIESTVGEGSTFTLELPGEGPHASAHTRPRPRAD
jgi:two-component system, OmpR family, sensor kinase